MMKVFSLILFGLSLLLGLSFFVPKKEIEEQTERFKTKLQELAGKDSSYLVGQAIDSLHGVKVYYNGQPHQVWGRNRTAEGYNLGLKYQCVEFVKRYYYEHLNHKMPDTYGHAKDFFNKNLSDSSYNAQRDLMQYSNPAKTQPQVGDLLIFKAIEKHVYGHVAIISRVEEKEVEIIQQNPLWTEGSRAIFPLVYENEHWKIKHELILGWLRKETM